MAKYSLKQASGYIHVIYAHQDKRMRVSSRIRAEGLLNEEKGTLIQKHPDYGKAQRIIDGIMEDILKAVAKVKGAGFEPTVGMVRHEYKNLRVKASEPRTLDQASFFELMDRHLQSKTKIRTLSTYTNLNQTADTLKEFQAFTGWKVEIDTFNRERFNQLIDFYLGVKKYSDSTIDKHIRCLRAFLKAWYPAFDRSFMKYDWKKDENIIFLTDSEVRLLKEADLHGPLEKTRDLFIFCCLTGMRYSDLADFNPAWIQDGVFVFNQNKTGGIAMPPVFMGAQQILKKYNNKLPVITNQKMNFYLKDLIGEVLPERTVETVQYRGGQKTVSQVLLSEIVTTHTARKTFITLALSHGIPIQDVMKMSGHSDFRGMRPYIAVTKEHIKNVSKKWDI